MAFKLVRSAGSVHEPAVVSLPASGVVHAGGVVIFDAATNYVSPASSASTSTNILGVALDYTQGKSEYMVRVIPFVPGQLWEGDCANVISTASVLLRHQLVDDLTVRNITGGLGGAGETASTGIFLAYAVTGISTGSGKLIGRFLQYEGGIKTSAYAVL